MKRKSLVLLVAILILLLLTACADGVQLDFSDVDYASSIYKHINNGGITDDKGLPYNVDAITSATLTVEGPGVVTSIPLSMRELENRTVAVRTRNGADLGAMPLEAFAEKLREEVASHGRVVLEG